MTASLRSIPMAFMIIPSIITRTLKSSVVPLFCGVVLFYLGSHLVNGDRGIFSMLRLRAEVAQANDVLTKETARRAELEHAVELLRPDQLDPDMLDERARAILNVAHPNDFVLMYPPSAAAQQDLVVPPTEDPH